MATSLEQLLRDIGGLSAPQQPQQPQQPQGALGAAYGNPMLWAQGRQNMGARVSDGQKAYGFFGKLVRPDGGISTELSFDFDYGGKNIHAPLLVPTLGRQEIDHLLSGRPPTEEIYNKAIEHATQRIGKGMQPWANPFEMYPVPGK